eukprot:1481081-Pyramimonas_sp.AAC.1
MGRKHNYITMSSITRIADLGVDRRLPTLKLAMFKPKSLAEFPALKAKAAVSRSLVKVMLTITKRVLPENSQIVQAYRLMNEFLTKCQK